MTELEGGRGNVVGGKVVGGKVVGGKVVGDQFQQWRGGRGGSTYW